VFRDDHCIKIYWEFNMKSFFSLKSFSFAFDSKGPSFFEDISFDIERPGITFILGKNGAGKSTLFRLFQGIVHRGEHVQGLLTLGSTVYNFQQPSDRQKLYNASMILHQSFDKMLAPSFTGFENLQFAQFDQNPDLSLVSVSHDQSHFIRQLNIPLDKPVYQLSGGQRQMLAMLMTTQKSLGLLLLDEPTAALDSKNSDYVMQGIGQLAAEKKISVFCVAHDMDLVQKYAANVVTISQEQSGKRVCTVT